MPPIREPRLKKLEAMAGMKNLPLVFKMPITTAESEIKTRKGNMILVSCTVSAVLPGTRPKSGARMATISSEKKIPRRVRKLKRMRKKVSTLAASRQVSAWDRFV
ncbi:MAG: hypothetical protein ACD_75C01965G0001 [uncultured bacterium]|nr:MAG: hypothetical protein ACD_75C01965G0001 [uncultured bacterium]